MGERLRKFMGALGLAGTLASGEVAQAVEPGTAQNPAKVEAAQNDGDMYKAEMDKLMEESKRISVEVKHPGKGASEDKLQAYAEALNEKTAEVNRGVRKVMTQIDKWIKTPAAVEIIKEIALMSPNMTQELYKKFDANLAPDNAAELFMSVTEDRTMEQRVMELAEFSRGNKGKLPEWAKIALKHTVALDLEGAKRMLELEYSYLLSDAGVTYDDLTKTAKADKK